MKQLPITEAILADLSLPSRCWHEPVLIGIFGLPCTGKTEVAHYLAEQHPLVVLSTDALRLRYHFPSGPATHAAMDQIARALLTKRISVVFDGVHLGQRDRAHVREVGQQQEAHARIIYTTAEPHVIAQRLHARASQPEQTSTAGKFVINPEHFTQIASYLEAPTPDEDVVTIDTSDGAIGTQLGPFEAELSKWWRLG